MDTDRPNYTPILAFKEATAICQEIKAGAWVLYDAFADAVVQFKCKDGRLIWIKVFRHR